MTRREHDRLRDIKDAITAIREHLAGAEDLAQEDNALLHDALLDRSTALMLPRRDPLESVTGSCDRPAPSRAVADR
jgi:hypothetical protein